MKSFNIYLSLFIILGVANGYDVQCNRYYNVNEGDECLTIANSNEISLNLLHTLNPDINCNDLPVDTILCLSGETNITDDDTIKDNDNAISINEETTNNTPIDYDNEKIKDISRVLSLKHIKAKKLYESTNEGISIFDEAFITSVENILSVDECKIVCEQANEKFNSFVEDDRNDFNITTYNIYLQAVNKEVLSSENLLNKCINKCFMIKEIKERIEDTSNPEDTLNIKKRADQSCDNPSQGKINLVQNEYMYGFNLYSQATDSVYTALQNVNGCSIPIIEKLYNQNNNGLFVPACNSHDICYNCQGGKKTCDLRFHDNMKTICKNWKNDNAVCNSEADLFYAAVSIAGGSSYNKWSSNEVRKTCAFCGTALIQDILLYTPYYVQ
ncbi:hypothetical protein H8356DRAFT_1032225 [Neocallimastix lanati (nom. inval.)]|jgi:hypothetical protein|uniref:LysM domain-containing protein n=1 Tax=Neocallimastix californiae TaxID=1754190 RepID=A0A1Y1YEG9_9FUNG|nr:hypothetical protein H8356DRAFT_1032225 [Neocallimastix sp. JGI-2020a]ORX95984.1 hypothetical protein LY90DRAFT_643583 [Neocallimastix californiae]|eukprot:ORX95984.1 hypothetical protein LY90DRAFT_643583 [Neocallimastix californiae]